MWVRVQLHPAAKRDDWGLCHSHHSSDFWRFVPINLEWVYGGLDSCHQLQIGQNWTLQGAGGEEGNLHMGDVSLKFVGDAHPGAVIGTDQPNGARAKNEIKRAKGETLHIHILEQKLAPIVHERPFDAARMPLQRLLYRLRLEPRAHGKVSSVQVAETGIVPHAHARIPEQHRAKVEGPNRTFATDSVEVAMSVGRE